MMWYKLIVATIAASCTDCHWYQSCWR